MEETHLFLDDEEILYRPGTRRVLHPPRHRSREPLLPADKPWEQRSIGYCGVHRDSQTGRYRMWYQACALETARERTHRITVCYAESEDGIHWTKHTETPLLRAAYDAREDLPMADDPNRPEGAATPCSMPTRPSGALCPMNNIIRHAHGG